MYFDDSFDVFMKILFVLFVVSVPLAVWKMVEIVIWIVRHVSIYVH